MERAKEKIRHGVIFADQMNPVYQSDICTVKEYKNEFGTLIRAQHTVFPGISLLYKDYRLGGCTCRVVSPAPNILSIEHCMEGRVEFRMNEECFFLTAGDVVLRRTDGASRNIHFPAEVHRGININIDLDQVPRCLNCILSDVDVEPRRLLQKFGLEDRSFHYLRKNKQLSHIFEEFYAIPEPVRKGYLKVKVLEVLLFLTGMELPEYDNPRRKLSKAQIQIARDAHAWLAAHMNEHITIAALAQQFGISQTQLKDSFRLVYGTSVQGFICELKMKAAAGILTQTDRKIADIAAEFGYANASKFSTAFQRIMGMTPAQYRTEME